MHGIYFVVFMFRLWYSIVLFILVLFVSICKGDNKQRHSIPLPPYIPPSGRPAYKLEAAAARADYNSAFSKFIESSIQKSTDVVHSIRSKSPNQTGSEAHLQNTWAAFNAQYKNGVKREPSDAPTYNTNPNGSLIPKKEPITYFEPKTYGGVAPASRPASSFKETHVKSEHMATTAAAAAAQTTPYNSQQSPVNYTNTYSFQRTQSHNPSKLSPTLPHHHQNQQPAPQQHYNNYNDTKQSKDVNHIYSSSAQQQQQQYSANGGYRQNNQRPSAQQSSQAQLSTDDKMMIGPPTSSQQVSAAAFSQQYLYNQIMNFATNKIIFNTTAEGNGTASDSKVGISTSNRLLGVREDK